MLHQRDHAAAVGREAVGLLTGVELVPTNGGGPLAPCRGGEVTMAVHVARGLVDEVASHGDKVVLVGDAGNSDSDGVVHGDATRSQRTMCIVVAAAQLDSDEARCMWWRHASIEQVVGSCENGGNHRRGG